MPTQLGAAWHIGMDSRLVAQRTLTAILLVVPVALTFTINLQPCQKMVQEEEMINMPLPMMAIMNFSSRKGTVM